MGNLPLPQRQLIVIARALVRKPTLLILDAEGLPTVSLAGPALPPAGTTVTVVGNPLGYPRVAMRGTIKGYVGTGPESGAKMATLIP